MKKSILKLSLLFTLLGLSFASCSDDDEKQPEPDAVTVTVKYGIPDRYDLVKYTNMTVYYTNSEGKEVSETVTSPKWEKSITKVPVPGTYRLKVVYTRNNTPLEQESYKFGTGLKISYIKSDGSFEEHGTSGSTSAKSKEVAEKYLSENTEDETSIEIKK